MVTRAGILLRPGEEKNTMNEIENALDLLTDESLEAFATYLENLLNKRDNEQLLSAPLR